MQNSEETFSCLSNDGLWYTILNNENTRLYMANQRLYDEVRKLNNQGDRILKELETRQANYNEQLKKMTDYIAMIEEINRELRETIARLRTQNKDLFYDRN